ncbi:uncharacterized protein LOC142786443 isoform X1 [Rhipicephalus microplus]|uniref:uncharacterized protein LOC142786443 isoform X1 n=1 Tax=Rhipicephalus microplus TaxID=6941 RepID=UPI003F6C425E
MDTKDFLSQETSQEAAYFEDIGATMEIETDAMDLTPNFGEPTSEAFKISQLSKSISYLKGHWYTNKHHAAAQTDLMPNESCNLKVCRFSCIEKDCNNSVANRYLTASSLDNRS